MNNIECDNLLVKQFQELNITIYGTHEEPLFKAKDIGELLEIKDIKTTLRSFDEDEVYTMPLIDSIGRFQETNMLKEQGLYKLLMISRKPIAKIFQKWVYNVIKELRLTGEYKLKQELELKLQQKELEYKNELQQKEDILKIKEQEILSYRNKTYEEIDKPGHIYVLKCDGGVKVGKTNGPVNKRKQQLQTANINNIETLFDFKTSNSDILEKVVHYILEKYRCPSRREFFECNTEYMTLVIEIAGKTIDTLKSTFEFINKVDLYEKLNINITEHMITFSRQEELRIEAEKYQREIIKEKEYQDELARLNVTKREYEKQQLKLQKIKIEDDKIKTFINDYVIINDNTKENIVKKCNVYKLYKQVNSKDINMECFIKHLDLLPSIVHYCYSGWSGFALKQKISMDYENFRCATIPSLDFLISL